MRTLESREAPAESVRLLVAAASLVLSGCGSPLATGAASPAQPLPAREASAGLAEPTPTGSDVATLGEVVVAPDRFLVDSQGKARRQPLGLLEFRGVRPGRRVAARFLFELVEPGAA